MRMSANPIVEGFDVLEDFALRLRSCDEQRLMDEFDLERGEEALGLYRSCAPRQNNTVRSGRRRR